MCHVRFGPDHPHQGAPIVLGGQGTVWIKNRGVKCQRLVCWSLHFVQLGVEGLPVKRGDCRPLSFRKPRKTSISVINRYIECRRTCYKLRHMTGTITLPIWLFLLILLFGPSGCAEDGRSGADRLSVVSLLGEADVDIFREAGRCVVIVFPLLFFAFLLAPSF